MTLNLKPLVGNFAVTKVDVSSLFPIVRIVDRKKTIEW
jgi:hypothetical protein